MVMVRGIASLVDVPGDDYCYWTSSGELEIQKLWDQNDTEHDVYELRYPEGQSESI